MQKATFAAILAMFTLYSTSVTAMAADDKTTSSETTEAVRASAVYVDDCAPTDWYASAVRYVVGRSLMDCTGTVSGKNNFSPKSPILRQEVAETLYRTFRLSDKAAAEVLAGKEAENFEDFDTVGDGCRDGVRFCVTSGIMVGDNAGLIHPYGTITREEYAVMLSRFLDVLEKYDLVDDVVEADGTEIKGFADGNGVSEWAKSAVGVCIKNELMQGVSATVFNPKGTVTRAQMAQVIYNISPEKARN